MWTAVPASGRLGARDALAFLLVAIVWLAVATWHLELPGLYMDAVNPDYLAVRLLNPHHAEIVEWVLPGNYLFGRRVPLLIALYHGSQTLWFGLPVYALLGTTLESLRLAHALFGLAVLGALYMCLRRARVSWSIAAVTCVALAVDPGFSYAFRTQSYITMFGVAWVLLSIAILLRARHVGTGWWRSGFFGGFAASAYFIHAFFLVALGPAVLLLTRRRDAGRARLQWLAGLVLGLLPYIAGYLLLMRNVGGPDAFLRFYAEQSNRLEAFSSSLSLVDRVRHDGWMVKSVVSDAWHHAMMFGPWQDVPGTPLKLVLLLALPIVLWGLAEVRRRASAALRMFVALPCAFFIVALLFGDRLWGHHFVVLLPLLYGALVLGLCDVLRALDRPAVATVVAAALAIALVSVNAAGQMAEMRELQRTGGVGNMSDAIDRLAADLNAASRKPFMFFPEWGLALPVIFLTNGSVGMDTDPHYDRARSLLCQGRDVAVGLIEDRDGRRAMWSRELAASPATTQYRQRDGGIAFEIITFRADAPHAGCPG